jgi:iron complex outermembrane receptor protein
MLLKKTESIAAYAQADWSITDKLTLTTGVRWTEEEKDFTGGQAYLAAHDIGGGRNFSAYFNGKKKWDDTSIKAGVTYALNDDSIVYASYTEGFHSGGYYAVVQNVSTMERNQYEPELSESIEVGYKALLMNKRVQLNVNYFLNDFMDKQEESTQLDPSTKTVASFLVKCSQC